MIVSVTGSHLLSYSFLFFVINDCCNCVACGTFNIKYCTYIFKILELLLVILNVKLYKGVHSIKYYKDINCIYKYIVSPVAQSV